jgi:hypothetical protein
LPGVCFISPVQICGATSIARDLLATDVVKNGFIPGNQEKYFRNMLAYGMFEMDLGRLEDTPRWAEDYFWEDLYRPYRGVPALPRRHRF